jgi:hypothetical protein
MEKFKNHLLISLLAVQIVLCTIGSLAIHITSFYPNQILRTHIHRTCTSEIAAIEQARKDIAADKKYILLWGLSEYDEAKAIQMRQQEQFFGFKFIQMGCVGGSKVQQIYDQIMRRTINQQAGKCVFRTFDSYTIQFLKIDLDETSPQ